MNSLVVYESRFGDTAQVARMIADTLREQGSAHLLAVGDVTANDLEGVDLLVVGGPTHAHGTSAALKRWLGQLADDALRDLPIAAFDTRYRIARILSGSAAKQIDRRLQRLGGRPIARPESFFVAAGEGPLVDGELDRAADWARGLAVGAARYPTHASAHSTNVEHWQPHV